VSARGFGTADRGPLLVIALVTAALVFAGYRVFFFLTDDAFIAFRYISNSALGHGLVWNPPPFQPVEGYTSWLWIALLSLIWQVAGIAPPGVSNVLSFAFGCATLVVVYKMVARMALPPGLANFRLALLALVLLGTATNRTFLTWLSSGLETALFNFAFTLWLYYALAPPDRRGSRWTLALCTAATLAALTRPDGMLIVAGSAALLAVDGYARRGPPERTLRELVWALPVLAVPAHLLWRRATYSEWLPNTYFAKYVEPWPEAGWRYAASFVLEYAIWVWFALVAIWGIAWLRRQGREGPRTGDAGHGDAWIGVAIVILHAGYYTFVIGGDHFEYRVYSHLVPLFFVSSAWLVARLDLRPRAACAVLGLFLLASWPLPWVHYFETRALETPADTFQMVRPVATRFPRFLRSYPRAFDALQAWLIGHAVCVRHQEHKVFYTTVAALLPSRAEGARIAWQGRPVHASPSVGLLGWRLPHVAMIDLLGLNDYVVARSASPPARRRLMAHDRSPPAGYVECFRPNVFVRRDTRPAERIEVVDRVLADAEIERCEAIYRARVRARGFVRKD
jgi:arabinofuranosyltransferase